MAEQDVAIETLFEICPLSITVTVTTTWLIMGLVWLVAWLISRNLRNEPGPLQAAIEGVVLAIEQAVSEVAPPNTRHILPFIGSLWIFLVIANLIGLVPGMHSPTRDLSATAALAILVFLSTHWFGIRIEGVHNYLRHYLTPSPVLLPFHIISEISRTVALAVRLFGNIMSHEFVIAIVVFLAGLFLPIPFMLLSILIGIIQAYIFTVLAAVYIGAATGAISIE